jgi:hypothetical protein
VEVKALTVLQATSPDAVNAYPAACSPWEWAQRVHCLQKQQTISLGHHQELAGRGKSTFPVSWSWIELLPRLSGYPPSQMPLNPGGSDLSASCWLHLFHWLNCGQRTTVSVQCRLLTNSWCICHFTPRPVMCNPFKEAVWHPMIFADVRWMQIHSATPMQGWISALRKPEEGVK